MSDTRTRYVLVTVRVRQLLEVGVESYLFEVKLDANVEAEVMVAAI